MQFLRKIEILTEILKKFLSGPTGRRCQQHFRERGTIM